VTVRNLVSSAMAEVAVEAIREAVVVREAAAVVVVTIADRKVICRVIALRLASLVATIASRKAMCLTSAQVAERLYKKMAEGYKSFLLLLFFSRFIGACYCLLY